MRSWHDYHLVGYAVDGAGAILTMQIRWPYDVPNDVIAAELCFAGVAGYFLRHDLGGNIVYAFQERRLDDFLDENAVWFAEQWTWGWPAFWKGDVETTASGLRERSVRCFELSSSYGMDGWILARDVIETVRNPE